MELTQTHRSEMVDNRHLLVAKGFVAWLLFVRPSPYSLPLNRHILFIHGKNNGHYGPPLILWHLVLPMRGGAARGHIPPRTRAHSHPFGECARATVLNMELPLLVRLPLLSWRLLSNGEVIKTRQHKHKVTVNPGKCQEGNTGGSKKDNKEGWGRCRQGGSEGLREDLPLKMSLAGHEADR